MSPTADQYLSVGDLADMIGVSRQTIYRMIGNGTAPRARHFGHQIRFAQSDVNAWLDAA